MPSPTVWERFPELAVVVLILAALGVAVRWIWKEYKSERDADRQWREKQDAARDVFAEKQNQSWQATVNALADRWERNDKEREGTLKAIADATVQMLDKLDHHDDRAVNIESKIDTIGGQISDIHRGAAQEPVTRRRAGAQK